MSRFSFCTGLVLGGVLGAGIASAFLGADDGCRFGSDVAGAWEEIGRTNLPGDCSLAARLLNEHFTRTGYSEVTRYSCR